MDGGEWGLPHTALRTGKCFFFTKRFIFFVFGNFHESCEKINQKLNLDFL